MKQSLFLHTRELFPGSDIVRKYTFKTINARDNCALLARANHQLSQSFVNTRDESAHLAIVCPIQTAIMGLTRGYSAQIQKTDCFECRHHMI